MVRPTAGDARVLGHPIGDPRESVQLRRQVAYVGEDKGLYAYLTVDEMIRFTRSFYPDWCRDTEHRLRRDYQLPPDRKIKALSKGMRTKLALLLALSRRPALLMLDEPTEGLDPVVTEELLRTLAGTSAEGTAVFFSSHQLTDVERISDYVLMIDAGRLVMDIALDELRENYRRITLGFDTRPTEAAFRVPGVERIVATGKQLTILASSNTGEVVDRARNLHAISVDVSPVSLREVFLETVQEPFHALV